MYRDKTEDELMEDGFSIKMAHYYSDCMRRERASGIWDQSYIDWAHSRGFLAESASAYHLTDRNRGEYLSDYDYYKIWPLNSWERIWINDKLTLKYMLSGTMLDRYMPEYYYYCDAEKGLIPLVDTPSDGRDVMSSFCELLKKKGDFACKPNNGQGADGFCRLSYRSGEYRINNESVNRKRIEEFVNTHNNYIYTEYLLPEMKLSWISPLIHTLRMVVVSDSKRGSQILGGYLRFAKDSGDVVNHTSKLSAREFDYDTEVDWETGFFHSGRAVYGNRTEDMPIHPASGKMAEGYLDHWDQVLWVVREFSEKYKLCEYLGFDLCISTKGLKIMEINSHSGIKHMQIIRPLLKDGFSKKYFEEKIAKVRGMNEEEKRSRRQLWR